MVPDALLCAISKISLSPISSLVNKVLLSSALFYRWGSKRREVKLLASGSQLGWLDFNPDLAESKTYTLNHVLIG